MRQRVTVLLRQTIAGEYAAVGAMSEFEWRRLDEITVNLDSRRIPVKSVNRKPGPYPYYGASGIADYVDDYIFDGQYLLISEDGENLKTRSTPIAFIAKGKFWVNNHAHVLQGNEHADTNYLCYVFQVLEIQGYLTGSTRPKLTKLDLNRIMVPLPPLSEQRAIAAILAGFDDKIEANRRLNATLEATARALFQSWFVDFDPVRANAEGRQPDGMDAATAALFPDSFEESPLGPIPKGWGVGVIGDVAEFNKWTLSKRDNLDIIQYIEISEVQRGEIGEIKTYLRGEEPSRARRRLQHGDTVLSTVRPDRGAYFLALNPPDNLLVSTGFAVFTPTLPYWGFVHTAMIRDEFFERLGALADGAAYPAVTPETIAALPLVLPGEAVVAAFHSFCAPLYEKVAQKRSESRTLAETRDALLPRLVSGDVRVGEVGNV